MKPLAAELDIVPALDPGCCVTELPVIADKENASGSTRKIDVSDGDIQPPGFGIEGQVVHADLVVGHGVVGVRDRCRPQEGDR